MISLRLVKRGEERLPVPDLFLGGGRADDLLKYVNCRVGWLDTHGRYTG